jgi:phosphoglycolate phosphatase
MDKHFILFDFDGVIADTFKAGYETARAICPHTTENDYRKRFEGNINSWQENNEHTAECRLNADFAEEYLPNMKKYAKIFPEMKDVVTKLSENYSLIIVSSTTTEQIQSFLKKYGLENHFTEIMGNDVHHSKIEKIKLVFSKYNTNSKNCVFITDTLGDITEAKHNDVNAICVSWGFNYKEALLRGQPFKIVDKPEDLPGAISDYFSKV